jgi:hypothetical protein
LCPRTSAGTERPLPVACSRLSGDTGGRRRGPYGGQRPVAAYLLKLGANINWVGHGGLTPLEAARSGGAVELADWLSARGAVPADHLH